MRHLKPIRIVGLALEPVTLDDGTLLFLHRRTNAALTDIAVTLDDDTQIFLHRRTDNALTGIAVIPAEDIHEYALTGNMEYAAMTIPFDEDIEGALHKAFPEKGVDTNFIFGSQAARAYDDGELFDDDSERKPHTLAEYDAAAAMHEGQFVHHTWSTKAEADAYRQGLNDMFDWYGYIEVEDKNIKEIK